MTPPPRLALALAASLALIGCGGRLSAPTVEPTPWVGPAIALDSSTPEHVMTFEAPSPGYLLFVDRVDRAREPSPDSPLGVGFHTAYVTIQEPDPAFVYPQVIVNQRLALGVPSTEPVKLFVRQVPFGARATAKPSYRPAAKSPGVP